MSILFKELNDCAHCGELIERRRWTDGSATEWSHSATSLFPCKPKVTHAEPKDES